MKSRVTPFFPPLKGAEKQSSCLPCMAGAVSSPGPRRRVGFVVDLHAAALKHPWFHTCEINTNTVTDGENTWLFVAGMNTDASRHLRSDSRHLGGIGGVETIKRISNPLSCSKMATVQIQRCKRRVEVHIYILDWVIWANSHIIGA